MISWNWVVNFRADIVAQIDVGIMTFYNCLCYIMKHYWARNIIASGRILRDGVSAFHEWGHHSYYDNKDGGYYWLKLAW